VSPGSILRYGPEVEETKEKTHTVESARERLELIMQILTPSLSDRPQALHVLLRNHLIARSAEHEDWRSRRYQSHLRRRLPLLCAEKPKVPEKRKAAHDIGQRRECVLYYECRDLGSESG
jgi:hypothetical protein